MTKGSVAIPVRACSRMRSPANRDTVGGRVRSPRFADSRPTDGWWFPGALVAQRR